MSIYSQIRIIFSVAVFFTTAFFGTFLYMQKMDDIKIKEKRYVQMVLLMQSLYQIPDLDLKDEDLRQFLGESEFIPVKSAKESADVLKSASLVLDKNISHSNMRMLRVYGDFYLYIKDQNNTILLKDIAQRDFLYVTVVLYIASMLLLLVLYFWLTHSFKPLKELQKQIQKISKGDLSVSVKSNRNDEIAEVANAFDEALRKLESLINSRQLFLRSIMHELKTPISKGKLLNEFLEDEKQKLSYDAIFERLQLLIEEFSKIEKMLSSSYTLKISKCNAIDIVEHALELMIMDEEEISQKVFIQEKSTYMMDVDFELLSLALKNLIDNALKYSKDNKVEIEISKEGISISNLGEEFTQSLDRYLQPFSQNSHGLGLGLYIVLNIVKMLKLNLTYTYNNSKNTFFLTMLH